jgi:hypothetical protein
LCGLRVRADYRERWFRECADRNEPLKRPSELRLRPLSSEDYIDSALIGWMEVKDIVAGKIIESQIPEDVISAWKRAYPKQCLKDGSFVDAVQKHAGNADSLRGLVSGVRGKLFEINYCDYLNRTLPQGFTAELSQSPIQTGHDIIVRDSDGHIAEYFQNKASDSISYIKAAITQNPHIPVVLPHDVFDTISDHSELIGHLVDGQEDLDALKHAVTVARDHAEVAGEHFAAAVSFHVPVLNFAVAAVENYARYRMGSVTLRGAIANTTTRGILATFANVAALGAITALHTSMLIRFPSPVAR